MEAEQHYFVELDATKSTLTPRNIVHLADECFSHDVDEDGSVFRFYFAEKVDAESFAAIYRLHYTGNDTKDGKPPKKRKI